MAGTQRLLAITMAFFLAGIPGSGKADALGFVVLADHANSGPQAATEGTTTYDGDRLSTDAGGSLRIQAGEAFIYLPDQSCVVVHKETSGAVKAFDIELVSGAVGKVLMLTAVGAVAATGIVLLSRGGNGEGNGES